jgi:hypothetical protein
LIGNSAGLRAVLSSRVANTDLRSSLWESHSFLSLPADTTMASSQGTQPQHPFLAIHSAEIIASYKYIPFQIPLLTPHFTPSNIMADVASKQQTTALFLSTTVTRTRRHTELTKKIDKPDGETCAVPEQIQFIFSCSILYSSTAQFNLECMGPVLHTKMNWKRSKTQFVPPSKHSVSVMKT